MAEENLGMEYAYDLARKRIAHLEKVIATATQDLSLIVAKHAIGKDRTVIRMAKYLNAENRKRKS